MKLCLECPAPHREAAVVDKDVDAAEEGLCLRRLGLKTLSLARR